MKEKDTKTAADDCSSCDDCCHGSHNCCDGHDAHHGGCCGKMHGFSLIRLGIFLLILAFVFWAGVKLGEFKAEFSNRYFWTDGQGMGRFNVMGGYGYEPGQGMMFLRNDNLLKPTSTKAK